MKKIFFILSILCLVGSQHAHAQDLSGIYSITRAVSANNFEFTGKVKIEGEYTCTLDWWIPNSEEYHGIGLLNREKDTLAVAYSSHPDYGLIVYKVDGGKLSGEWFTQKTEEFSGYEELEGPPGLNGTYQIKEAVGDDYGDPYSGTVKISQTGQVYHLTWYSDDIINTGVGLLKGNTLMVAWGDDAGVLYFDIKGDELLGTFAAMGANQTGVENLVRISPLPEK